MPPVAIAPAGVDGRVRLLRFPDEVDITAVVCRRVVVLVDSGATPHDAMAALALLGDALVGRDLLVVNTHADYDHAWGNQAFVGPDAMRRATVIGSRACAERLLGTESGADLIARAKADERFRGVRLEPPTVTFERSLVIEGGDLTLRLLPAPGHSEDQVVVWIPEIRTLLAADAAEHPFPIVDGAPSLERTRATLHTLAALDPVAVIPCHGGTTDAGLLTRNVAYFDEVARRCAVAPAGAAGRDDVDEAVGFPFADALALAGADPTGDWDFYRAVHARALNAQLEALRP